MEVKNLTAFASVSQPLIYGGTPKIIFRIPSNPYLLREPLQAGKFDSGERLSITAELLSREIICMELLYVIYRKAVRS